MAIPPVLKTGVLHRTCGFDSHPLRTALVVQWIERELAELLIEVRILSSAHDIVYSYPANHQGRASLSKKAEKAWDSHGERHSLPFSS